MGTKIIDGILDVAGTIKQNGTNVSLEGHNHDDRYSTGGAVTVSNGAATLSNNTAQTVGTVAGTALTCQLGSAITISGQMTAESFYASSDLKLKENIKDYTPDNSILDLPIVEFDFKESKSHQIGCIAQDLQNLFPELVSTSENDYLTIAENKLVYLCILEIKKLRAELDALKMNKK